MAEYHVSWREIDEHWTWEQTLMFTERMNERRKAQAQQAQPKGKGHFLDSIGR